MLLAANHPPHLPPIATAMPFIHPLSCLLVPPLSCFVFILFFLFFPVYPHWPNSTYIHLYTTRSHYCQCSPIGYHHVLEQNTSFTSNFLFTSSVFLCSITSHWKKHLGPPAQRSHIHSYPLFSFSPFAPLCFCPFYLVQSWLALILILK